MGHIKSDMKGHIERTSRQVEKEAVGDLMINSDGEGFEWDYDHLGGQQLYSGDMKHHSALEEYQHQQNKAASKHHCEVCGKDFSTQVGLCQHKKNHPVKPHECVHCRKRFAYRNPLEAHLQTHSKEETFPCPACGKSFCRLGKASSHVKTHCKKSTGVTSGEEGAAAAGGLINSDREEVEWDSASCGLSPDTNQTGAQQLEGSMDLSCCQVCGKEFNNNGALQRHQKIHIGAEPHKCSQCGKGFRFLKRLKRHHLIHSKEKPFLCPVCDKRLSCKDRLKEHLSTHNGWVAEAKDIAEALDGEEAASSLIISEGAHMKWNPEGKDPDVESLGDEPVAAGAKPKHSVKTISRKRRKKDEAGELFSCTDCNKEFQSMYARDRHTREKHGKHLLHKCRDCGQTFRAHRSLIVHWRIYHPAPGTPVEPHEERRVPKTYLCSTCGKEFPTSASLNRHLIIHSGRKPYKCTLCARGFTQIGNLRTHQKVHKEGKTTNVAAIEKGSSHHEESSEEVCFCHLCWTQFSGRKLLEEHLKQVHESKKPYACTECGKRFMYTQKLKEHQAGHEGLKPYQCSQCHKGFHTPKGLENHMRDHTGEKPFPCSMCGKRFKQASTLRAHYLTHSGERPHLCAICGKRYARAEELKVHLRVHTGEKPYQCDECGKSFYYRQGFNNHKKTHNAKPIGPTRQLGRPRQLGSPRKASKPKRVTQRDLHGSDGEDLTWEPQNLGNRPNHHLGNQDNHAAPDHSQIPGWNFGPHTSFNPWGQNPNTSYWRPAEGHQPYFGPAGQSMSFSALLTGTTDDEPLQESCIAERPSWPSGLPLIPAPLELGLEQKTHVSRMSHHDEQRPITQEQGHRHRDEQRPITQEQGHSHHDEQRPTTQEQGHSHHDEQRPTTQEQGHSHHDEQRPTTQEQGHSHHDEQRPTTQEQGHSHHDEETPTTQEQGHSTLSTGEACSGTATVDESNAPQKKLSEEPKQFQGTRKPKKNYDCPTCGRVFSHNTALRRHLVIHSGKRPFKCSVCGRGFTQSGNLKTHMKVHRGKLPSGAEVQEKSRPEEPPITIHVCGECGMDFPQKQQLEEHQKNHKKPYACPDCSKRFKNEYYFKIHKRIHSGDSPFLCSECGKSCVTADSLKKHELTHTGEKRFRCEQCGRAFIQSSHLNVHLKTHSGERPHLCSICGKSYSKACDLKVHLRVHTGEKPYTCEKCGKCFYYSQGYRAHLKTHDKKPKKPTKPLGRPKQQLLMASDTRREFYSNISKSAT